VLQRQGDDDAAEPMFARALAIHERTLGPEHPDLADALVGLARVAIDRGRGPQAVEFAERALALRERGDTPVELLALARVVLARALLVVDVHSTRAAQLADQACATFRSGGAALRFYLADCDAFAAAQRGD
jgi:eukaryotic-like serine/threonine-protein kinase